jgi:hypothetical protein
VLLEVGAQRAGVASRDGPAVRFADRDEQRMIFIEELYIMGERIHEKGLNLVVRSMAGDQSVARENSLSIRVNHKDWHVPRIQEDRVCGFWTNPGDLEQSFPDPRWFLPKHLPKTPIVSRAEKGEKVSEAPGFDGVGARGTDQLLEAKPRQGCHRRWSECPRPTETLNRLFDVAPVGVLGEDRPGDYLESASPGPPTLRPELCI